MKRFKIIFFIAFVILVLLPVAGYEYKKNINKNIINQDKPTELEQIKTQKKNGLLVKESFSIKLPDGWDETDTAQSTTTAMVLFIKEVLVDPIAQQMNFRSYYSVVGGATAEQNTVNQAKLLKKNLSDMIKGAVFSQEAPKKINGREAYSLESKFTQQGINLRVLIVFVKGEGSDMWRLSFNSTEDQWAKNRELFYQLAESFIVKS